MHEKLDPVSRRRLRQGLLQTGLVLGLERFVGAFWLAWTATVLAGALLLSGFLSLLNSYLHALLLLLLGCGLGWAFYFGWQRWQAPRLVEIRRRLEQGCSGKPASVLADHQAIGVEDPFARKLWELHREQAARQLDQLTPGFPNLRLSRLDPFALRALAVLLLLAAAFDAGPDWRGRVASSLLPNFQPLFAAAEPPRIDIWAEPPGYTGEPAIYLTERPDLAKSITVPAATRLQIRAYGAGKAPVVEQRFELAEDGTPGRQTLAENAPGNHEATIPLLRDSRISLWLGATRLGTWDIAVRPDLAPTIKFSDNPQATRTSALMLSYGLADDYGAARAWARVTPASAATGTWLGQSMDLEIPLAVPLTQSGAAEQYDEEGRQLHQESVIRDLTEHPLAGALVRAVLFVEDGAGQQARSRGRVFTLPAKTFLDPVAAALIEQRREIALAESEHDIVRAQAVLGAILRYPSEYFEDRIAFLAASVARRRLEGITVGLIPREELESVLDLLWKAANRLENGDLAATTANLQDAIERLEQALAGDATDQEIAELVQQLREAIQSYLQAVQAQGVDPAAPTTPADISSQTIEDMLNSFQGSAQLGQREQARQMLAEMRSLLENLRVGSGRGNPLLDELGKLLNEQTDLADRTMRQQRLGAENPAPAATERRPKGPPGSGGGEAVPDPYGYEGSGIGGDAADGSSKGNFSRPGGLGSEQSALQSRLQAARDKFFPGPGDASRRLSGGLASELGDFFNQANQAMGKAAAGLQAGDSEAALESQLDAINSLQKIARRMVAEGEGSGGVRSGFGGLQQSYGNNGGQNNPFGDSEIPGFGDVQRARQLFDAIRQRAGERARPTKERSYYERLLERF